MTADRKAIVAYCPEVVDPMVTMHACWSADNGHETAVFPTERDAIDFAWKRWRMEAVVDRRKCPR